MTAAIAVILTLVAVGAVTDALFRLRDWLHTPPPGGDGQEPPGADG